MSEESVNTRSARDNQLGQVGKHERSTYSPAKLRNEDPSCCFSTKGMFKRCYNSGLLIVLVIFDSIEPFLQGRVSEERRPVHRYLEVRLVVAFFVSLTQEL